jgi:hypothetical protein
VYVLPRTPEARHAPTNEHEGYCETWHVCAGPQIGRYSKPPPGSHDSPLAMECVLPWGRLRETHHGAGMRRGHTLCALPSTQRPSCRDRVDREQGGLGMAYRIAHPASHSYPPSHIDVAMASERDVLPKGDAQAHVLLFIAATEMMVTCVNSPSRQPCCCHPITRQPTRLAGQTRFRSTPSFRFLHSITKGRIGGVERVRGPALN